jgi:hypothetical protein
LPGRTFERCGFRFCERRWRGLLDGFRRLFFFVFFRFLRRFNDDRARRGLDVPHRRLRQSDRGLGRGAGFGREGRLSDGHQVRSVGKVRQLGEVLLDPLPVDAPDLEKPVADANVEFEVLRLIHGSACLLALRHSVG